MHQREDEQSDCSCGGQRTGQVEHAIRIACTVSLDQRESQDERRTCERDIDNEHRLPTEGTRENAAEQDTNHEAGRAGTAPDAQCAVALGTRNALGHPRLDLVELMPAARRQVKTYSLGMRQRLGLAAALLGDPELVILDEPANGLDPVGVHWLRTLLRSFAAEGRTVLVSSHVLAEVAQTVDQIAIIDRGRIVSTASLEELTTNGRTLEDSYLELTARKAS